MVEESTGPEITVFQRFRKHQFELRYSEVENLHFFELTELRDDVVGLLKSVLADKTFAYRGDYTGLLLLTQLEPSTRLDLWQSVYVLITWCF